MVIAALISFAILLVAWMVAPSGDSATPPTALRTETEPGALPVAA